MPASRGLKAASSGDDDLFDDNGFGDGWTLDNLPYGYAAAVSALEYNEGSVDLVIRAGAAAGDAGRDSGAARTAAGCRSTIDS